MSPLNLQCSSMTSIVEGSGIAKVPKCASQFACHRGGNEEPVLKSTLESKAIFKLAWKREGISGYIRENGRRGGTDEACRIDSTRYNPVGFNERANQIFPYGARCTGGCDLDDGNDHRVAMQRDVPPLALSIERHRR